MNKPHPASVDADSAAAPPVPVALPDIEAAAARIAGRVTRTPLVASPSLSHLCRQPVHLKLEPRQPIGAFKLRGAMNAVLALGADQRRLGVVTASIGHHGRTRRLGELPHAIRAAGAGQTIDTKAEAGDAA